LGISQKGNLRWSWKKIIRRNSWWRHYSLTKKRFKKSKRNRKSQILSWIYQIN